jgi:hypothetical protein
VYAVDGAALAAECPMESAGFGDVLLYRVVDLIEYGSRPAMPGEGVEQTGESGHCDRTEK